MYFSTGAQLQAALSALPTSKVGSYVAFDAFYYGSTYMGAYSGTLTPIEHFVQIGAPRGYKPNADFDPVFYAEQYADLKGQGFDAADLLYHFMQYGLDEGRAQNVTYLDFDGAAYLAAYPDVKAYVEANLDQFGGSLTNGAIAHFVKFGEAEGRVAPGVSTGEIFTLTDEMDDVPSASTLVKGIVDGSTVANSTFTVGDEINLSGANDTTVRLSVIDGGTAGYVYMSNVDNVDILAGDTSTINFNAGDWTNIGSVNLAGGADGLTVEVDALEDGTDLRIGATVAGQIEGNYQSGLSVTLNNDADGGASFVDGDVTLNAAAGASAWAYFSGNTDVTIGDVNGVGADASFLGVSAADITGDVTVGSVNLADTGAAYVRASFDDIIGDVTVGNVTLAAGDSGTAQLTIAGIDGTVTVGNVTLAAGDSGSVTLDASVTGNLAIGDVSLSAGNEGWTRLDLDASGDIVVGNLTSVVGENGDLNAFIDAENVTIGDVNMTGGNFTGTTAGDNNTAEFDVSASGVLNVGNVTVALGDAVATSSYDAYYGLDVQLTNSSGSDLTVGNVDLTIGSAVESVSATATASATASVSLDIHNNNAIGNLLVGDVTVSIGNEATADIEIDQSGTTAADVGTFTVGAIDVTMGDSAALSIDLINSNAASTTTMDVGAMTVGDISVVAGTGASIDVSITQKLSGTSGGNVGDVTVGNVSLTAGINGDANFYLNVTNSASGDVGNVTLGDVTFALDDGGAMDFGVYVSADEAIGNVTVGKLTIDVGVSGSITDTLDYSISGASIGDIVIGDIAITLGQSASMSGSLSFDISASTGDIGDLTIGNRTWVVGENANFNSYSYFTIDAAGDIGNISIGDLNVDVGVDAFVSELQYGTISASGDIESITWGSIVANVAAGGSLQGVLEFDINADNIGNVTFGSNTVTLADASGTTSAANFSYYDSLDISAVGNIGNVVFGDIVYDLGSYAYATSGVDRTIDAGGTLGDVTFGDLRMLAATSAYFSDSWNVNVTGDKGIGAVTFGDIELNGVDIVDSMDLNLYVNATSGDIESLTVGNILLSNVANSNSGTDLYLSLDVSASGSIGDVVLGDITLAATGSNTTDAGGAYMTVDWTGVGSFTGDVTIGNVSFEGNTSYSDITDEVLSVNLGTIGTDVVVGGITIKGDGTAVMGTNYVFDLDTSNSGDITINNISVEISATTDGLYSLSTILTDVTASGDIYLGTVDYSGYVLTNATATTGESIDVSTYLGEIAVIGTGRDDVITDNDEANSLTGGAGNDEFVFQVMGQNISTVAGAATAVIDVVTDFQAGASFADILTIDAFGAGTVANYSEGTATSFDNFITTALAKMADAGNEFDVVAIQVGSDTWIAVDEDGGDNIDHIIQLTGVSTATLNFADFNIV